LFLQLIWMYTRFPYSQCHVYIPSLHVWYLTFDSRPAFFLDNRSKDKTQAQDSTHHHNFPSRNSIREILHCCSCSRTGETQAWGEMEARRGRDYDGFFHKILFVSFTWPRNHNQCFGFNVQHQSRSTSVHVSQFSPAHFAFLGSPIILLGIKERKRKKKKSKRGD